MRCDRPTDLGANYAFTAQHYQRLRQPCQTDQHRHSDTILIYQNLIPPKHRADDKRRRGGGRATTVIRVRPPALRRSSSSVRLWHHVLLAISLSALHNLSSFLSSSLSPLLRSNWVRRAISNGIIAAALTICYHSGRIEREWPWAVNSSTAAATTSFNIGRVECR